MNRFTVCPRCSKVGEPRRKCMCLYRACSTTNTYWVFTGAYNVYVFVDSKQSLVYNRQNRKFVPLPVCLRPNTQDDDIEKLLVLV